MNYIRSQYIRAKSRFAEKLNGLLYGIITGDVLGLPFKHIPPGESIIFQDQKIDYIDKFYMDNIGFRDNWPIETTLALCSCKALIDIHEDDKPLKDTINSTLLTRAFLRYSPDDSERIIIDRPASEKIVRLNFQESLFMKFAPIAPFACRCRLNIQQTLDFAHLVAKISTKAFSIIFPAFEFLLILRSSFYEDESIPDVIEEIRIWSNNNGYSNDFEQYEKLRNLSLNNIPQGSDLWVWQKVVRSIIGFQPGERWLDIQGFDHAFLKIINQSYNRNRAGAVAGAILGSNWGKGRIPHKFTDYIRGDIFISDQSKRFVDVFHSFNKTKQYEYKEYPSSDTNKKEVRDEYTQPVLIYKKTKWLGCAFYTVVAKNESAIKKYQGGFEPFARKWIPRCNDKISIICDMGSDINSIVSDLEEHNMDFGNDYIVFDAASYAIEFSLNGDKEGKAIPIDLNVKWLKAYFVPGRGVEVCYNN